MQLQSQFRFVIIWMRDHVVPKSTQLVTVTVAVPQGLGGLHPGSPTEAQQEFLGTKDDLERMRPGRLDDFRMTRLRFAETGPAFEKLFRLLEKLAGDNKDLHARLSELTQKAHDFDALRPFWPYRHYHSKLRRVLLPRTTSPQTAGSGRRRRSKP